MTIAHLSLSALAAAAMIAAAIDDVDAAPGGTRTYTFTGELRFGDQRFGQPERHRARARVRLAVPRRWTLTYRNGVSALFRAHGDCHSIVSLSTEVYLDPPLPVGNLSRARDARPTEVLATGASGHGRWRVWRLQGARHVHGELIVALGDWPRVPAPSKAVQRVEISEAARPRRGGCRHRPASTWVKAFAAILAGMRASAVPSGARQASEAPLTGGPRRRSSR